MKKRTAHKTYMSVRQAYEIQLLRIYFNTKCYFIKNGLIVLDHPTSWQLTEYVWHYNIFQKDGAWPHGLRDVRFKTNSSRPVDQKRWPYSLDTSFNRYHAFGLRSLGLCQTYRKSNKNMGYRHLKWKIDATATTDKSMLQQT